MTKRILSVLLAAILLLPAGSSIQADASHHGSSHHNVCRTNKRYCTTCGTYKKTSHKCKVYCDICDGYFKKNHAKKHHC